MAFGFPQYGKSKWIPRPLGLFPVLHWPRDRNFPCSGFLHVLAVQVQSANGTIFFLNSLSHLDIVVSV